LGRQPNTTRALDASPIKYKILTEENDNLCYTLSRHKIKDNPFPLMFKWKIWQSGFDGQEKYMIDAIKTSERA
jgi:hypothetical protein